MFSQGPSRAGSSRSGLEGFTHPALVGCWGLSKSLSVEVISQLPCPPGPASPSCLPWHRLAKRQGPDWPTLPFRTGSVLCPSLASPRCCISRGICSGPLGSSPGDSSSHLSQPALFETHLHELWVQSGGTAEPPSLPDPAGDGFLSTGFPHDSWFACLGGHVATSLGRTGDTELVVMLLLPLCDLGKITPYLHSPFPSQKNRDSTSSLPRRGAGRAHHNPR